MLLLILFGCRLHAILKQLIFPSPPIKISENLLEEGIKYGAIIDTIYSESIKYCLLSCRLIKSKQLKVGVQYEAG